MSDFTIEALASVHQNNLRGVAVYADELAGWFKNFNRYNKGSEMEFWLSGWSGKPINVDRKTSEPIHISHPFIGVIGTIQNGILTELAKENRSQNGFIDRILFVMPTDLKKQSWSDSEISQQVIDDWNKILLSIFNTPSGFTQEGKKENYRVLKFNEHARKTLKEWQEYNTELCNAAETESISGIYSKIETYVLRFALVFEFILYGCKQSGGHEISAEALNAAIALAEYFRHTALKVNSIINNYDPLERLPGDKREFYDSLPDSFTTEIALTIAEKLKIPPRSAKRFLGNKELFKRLKRGLYEKME